MKKTKWKKQSRSLGASILSLILCISMLAGTTFAWFTDTATNTGNRVQMGELKFDLEMYKDAQQSEDGDGYVSIAGGSGDIFSESTGTAVRWEPGKTQIVFLKVENEGNIAANYNLQINVTDMDTEDDVDPASVLEYAVIDQLTASEYAAMNVQDWNALKSKAQTGKLKTGVTQAANFATLQPDKDNYFMLAVHMDEAADNRYKGKTVKIGVQLVANQKRYENGSEIYLLQADFEETKLADRTVNWFAGKAASTTEDHFVCGEEGTPSGKNYLKFGYGIGDASTRVWAGRVFYSGETQFLNGQEYTISFWMKYEKGTQNANVIPTLKFDFYDRNGITTTGGLTQTIEFKLNEVVAAEGEWVEVTRTFTMPDYGVTGMKVRVAVWQIDAETGANSADGIISMDNIRIFTYEEDPLIAEAQKFRDKIAKEEAASQQTAGSVFDPYGDRTLVDDVNLINDGSFANSTLNVPGQSSWFATTQAQAESGQWSQENSPFDANENSGSLQLTYVAQKNPWYYQDLYGLDTDVVYELRYDYKIVGTDAKGLTYAYVKVETGADPSLPGSEDALYDQVNLVAQEYVKDGEWHEAKMNFSVSENAYRFRFLPRMQYGTSAGCQILIDNIRLYKTQPSDMVSLDTDYKFYYAGEADETTLSATFLSKYFPDYTGVTVDFKVYDGETLVWEKNGNTFTNDVAEVQLPLSTLAKKAVPYCVKVILRDSEGVELDAATDNIFMYDRPEYLTPEGVLVKDLDGDGDVESFDYPVLGYHVNFDVETLTKIKEAGINLIQSLRALSADQALKDLDACYEAGIMMIMNLYPLTDEVDSVVDIVSRIRLLSDERVINHPALYGYVIKDEPFLHDQNAGRGLEISYRLVREYDTKHPVFSVEPHLTDIKKTSRYVDILIGDFYASATSDGVKTRTEGSVEIMNGRPLFTLIEAYSAQKDDKFPTGSEVRNNMWKAYLAGSMASGYYSISDGYGLNSGSPEPIYSQTATDIWDGMKLFHEKESKIAYDYFIAGRAEVFKEDMTGSKYWYSSRKTEDGSIYLVVLGRMDDGVNTNGEITLNGITAGTVELIAGEDNATIQNGKLIFSIDGVDVNLYKITPQ